MLIGCIILRYVNACTQPQQNANALQFNFLIQRVLREFATATQTDDVTAFPKLS